MLVLKCNGMRRLVVLAGLLFVLGIALQFVANLIGLNSGVASTQILYVGFFLALSSPMVLLSTVVFAVVTGKSEITSNCEH